MSEVIWTTGRPRTTHLAEIHPLKPKNNGDYVTDSIRFESFQVFMLAMLDFKKQYLMLNFGIVNVRKMIDDNDRGNNLSSQK